LQYCGAYHFCGTIIHSFFTTPLILFDSFNLTSYFNKNYLIDPVGAIPRENAPFEEAGRILARIGEEKPGFVPVDCAANSKVRYDLRCQHSNLHFSECSFHYLKKYCFSFLFFLPNR